MITTVLWDVDGTLLDFKVAERTAIKALFSEFGIGECTDAMLIRYSQINTSFWKRLEKNELTRPQVLKGRFVQFFGEYGIDQSIVPSFNERYQHSLGDTIAYRDDSLNIIKKLHGNVKQYVVSNGTVAAQTRKLNKSGIGDYMDGVFLSERLGVEKPNIGFFDQVFAEIGPVDPTDVLIVGDSLTSDIQGGINAGIKTCWYNPGREELPDGCKIDYMIADLHEVLDILESENAWSHRIIDVIL